MRKGIGRGWKQTYIEGIVKAQDELELGCEIASGTAEDTKDDCCWGADET